MTNPTVLIGLSKISSTVYDGNPAQETIPPETDSISLTCVESIIVFKFIKNI